MCERRAISAATEQFATGGSSFNPVDLVILLVTCKKANILHKINFFLCILR